MKRQTKLSTPRSPSALADGAVKREFMAHPFFWVAILLVAHATILLNLPAKHTLLEGLVRLALLWSIVTFMLAWVYRKLAATLRGKDLEQQTWIMTKRVLPLRLMSLILCVPYVVWVFWS